MRITFALALLVALVACAAPIPAPDDPVLVISDGAADAPAMSVADAIRQRAGGEVVAVSGALFVTAGRTVLLCDAIAESFPPQCGGERIRVQGVDLASIPGLQTEGEVSWAEAVTLLGSVE